MGKILCEVCKKKCKKEAIRLNEKYFHVQCFKCKACQKQLAMDGFYTKDEDHYCVDDYQRLFGTKCRACSKYVDGEVVTVLDYTYHQECFSCSKCRKKFEPGEKVTFSSSNKEHWCRKCVVPADDDASPSSPPGPGRTVRRPGDTAGSMSPTRQQTKSPVSNGTAVRGVSPQLRPSSVNDENAFDDSIIMKVNSQQNESSIGGDSKLHTSTSTTYSTKSTGSLPRFGVPNNNFYNISYLDRTSEFKRGPSANPNVREQPSRHYHRPENFSYTKVQKDFVKPKKHDYGGDKKEVMISSRKPDGQDPNRYLAPIERDDWPGPPDPAAAYPELFREKVYRKKSEGGDEVDSGGRTSVAEDRVNKEIQELSKMTDSGAAQVILQDLRKKRAESPTLDPRSASRTPSAAVEPPQKTRYESPIYASPSRDLDMKPIQQPPRPRSTDLVLDNRSSALRSSLPVPRPGYGLSAGSASSVSAKGHYYSDGETDQQVARPRSSAGVLESGAHNWSTSEEYDPTTGLKHSTLMRPSTAIGFAASFLDSKRLSGGKSFKMEDPPKIYPYDQLKVESDKLPPGVDKQHLEHHLARDDFEAVFQMSEEEFYHLPQWKRSDLKVRVGLQVV